MKGKIILFFTVLVLCIHLDESTFRIISLQSVEDLYKIKLSRGAAFPRRVTCPSSSDSDQPSKRRSLIGNCYVVYK